MTNEERDDMIKQTHDAVIVMVDKVESHHSDLYGNGKTGLKTDVDRLKVFNRVECWIGGAIILAIIAVVGKVAYAHISGQ